MAVGEKELVSGLQLLTVVAILYFGARKLVKEALKQRSESISKKIVDAKLELERIQFEANKAKSEISEINLTKEKLLVEVRDQGQKLYDQLVAEAKETAARILTDSKLAAQNEVHQAASRLKQQVVDQAVEVAFKMAESNDNKSVLHKGLVEQLNGASNGVS